MLTLTVLFVEVFLVVSITSGALQTIVEVATDIENLPTLLAQNLPDASNYFFSYLLLQGASVSSGTLLQISALVRISWLWLTALQHFPCHRCTSIFASPKR